MLFSSLLDNDLYKFTMMQFAFHHYPKKEAEYRLFFRNQNTQLNPNVLQKLPEEVAAISKLTLSPVELKYLESLSTFSSKFLNYLETFSLKKEQVILQIHPRLEIRIKGPWPEVILWEVILLALISELHFSHLQKEVWEEGKRKLQTKIDTFKKFSVPFPFMEFGTRRRISKSWQRFVNTSLQKNLPSYFLGTSNVKLAMDLNLPCLGTMGHEFLQAGQSLSPNFANFQPYMLTKWIEEHPKLSIALTDVLSLSSFLHDFSMDLAKNYKGLRIDSGDPIESGEKILRFYQKNKINPKDKVIVFSDSLDFTKASKIASHFQGKIPVQFGIGTYLTNDHGITPLNLVIKMVEFDHKPVGKLTDTPKKSVGFDPSILKRLETIEKTTHFWG